jgi:hypothetical protein
MTILTIANQFIEKGFSVVPLERGSKIPLVKWAEFQTHLAPTEWLNFWFSFPVNLGIVTGYNGLMVVDFDDYTEYQRWELWASNQSPLTRLAARSAFRVRTRRGMHVYFRMAQPDRNRHIDKVDIKGKYGLATGPGSIHASGAIYVAQNAFFVPTIEALSDVLPARLLVTKQEIHPAVKPPMEYKAVSDDPWETASMGSFTPDEDLVTAIRAKFKIQDFFQDVAKTSNHHGVTLCPFHQDESASFWIDTRKEICNCFRCEFPRPLDVINFYGMLYGLSNREAIWALQKML